MKPCRFDNDCGNACYHGRGVICGNYSATRTFKSFGWDVVVKFHDGHTETFHYRGCTEGGARRKGLLKILAREIVSVTPVTEQEWIRAYGIGRM